MKIKDDYERIQVGTGYRNVKKQLSEARSSLSGAIIRTNFGDSGSQELQEAHAVFKEVERLLYTATCRLMDIEGMI